MAAKPISVLGARSSDPCERGLELKIQMADLEAEYAELKPAIEAYCEANGGTYNSPLGSYATRYTPKYEYPPEIELARIALKQAEERARLDGSAVVVNTTVAVAATIVKNSPRRQEPIKMNDPDDPKNCIHCHRPLSAHGRFARCSGGETQFTQSDYVIESHPDDDLRIPPVDESAPIPEGATCQEASMFSRGRYLPCGAPATSMVRHEKDRRSYLMCAPCADHNIRNRGGILVNTKTKSDRGETPNRRKTHRRPGENK